jgi:hypothetical protein
MYGVGMYGVDCLDEVVMFGLGESGAKKLQFDGQPPAVSLRCIN